MTIYCERNERTDLGEAREPCVLVCFENGGHGTSSCTHLCEEVCGHGLAIYHEMGQVQGCSRLLITSEYMRNTSDQMQITAMRGGKQGVPLVVMQQHQCTTAEDFARATNKSSGNQRVCVDGFAMPVQVNMRG